MTTIEKKSKVKHWKYDFLFVSRDSGWGDLPGQYKEKPIRNPFTELFDEEMRTACYFLYYIQVDDPAYS